MEKFVTVSQLIGDVAQVRNINRRNSYKIVSKILKDENINFSVLATLGFGKKVETKIVTAQDAKNIFNRAKVFDLNLTKNSRDSKPAKIAYIETKTDHLEVKGYKVLATYKGLTFSVNLGRSLEVIKRWVDRQLARIDNKISKKEAKPEITVEAVKQLEQLLPDTKPEMLEALEPETAEVFEELEKACDGKPNELDKKSYTGFKGFPKESEKLIEDYLAKYY